MIGTYHPVRVGATPLPGGGFLWSIDITTSQDTTVVGNGRTLGEAAFKAESRLLDYYEDLEYESSTAKK